MTRAQAHLAFRLAAVALLVAAAHVAYAAAGASDARLSRATTRCVKFAELIACDEALSIKPDDPDLLIAEADALVQLTRPGEAIGVYRNALKRGAEPSAVNSRITAAATQRRSLLSVCMTQGGAEAEHSCESAWLPGAPDEVAVFKRRGELLKEDGQPAAALDAYLAAARLRPRDRVVAQAVVALDAGAARKDAQTLAAVGTALMTLGRRSQAIAAFRQALRVDPNLRAVKEQLYLAEHASKGLADAAPNPSPNPAPAAEPGDLGPFTNEAEATRSN